MQTGVCAMTDNIARSKVVRSHSAPVCLAPRRFGNQVSTAAAEGQCRARGANDSSILTAIDPEVLPLSYRLARSVSVAHDKQFAYHQTVNVNRADAAAFAIAAAIGEPARARMLY
jgi:hypothetical protein